MELYSPRPEHAQLSTNVTPKDNMDILQLLQPAGPLSSLRRIATNTQLADENGNGNGNGNGNDNDNDNDNDNSSNVTEYSTNTSAANEASASSNGSPHGNTPRYDVRYGIPLGTVIDNTQLNFMNQRSLSTTAPNIDSMLEEHLIPSPPMSPKFRADDVKTTLQDVEPIREGIYVKPCWEKGLSAKRYRYSNAEFLSQYRVFDGIRGLDNLPRANRYTRRYKSIRYDLTDFEKIQRTRRRGTSAPISNRENCNSYYESTRAPSTPVRHIKKSTPTISLPLASANAITSTPQYVPNMSWEKLPDYSPSLSTIPPNNLKCMKVEWKGSSMDLSHDPLRHKLHPAELILAQILRLPCDLYLDSKRRLFLEKMYRYKKGLPFRRTDAQKACRIDVNKASRLYAAFEKIGWLEDSNFDKFL